MQNTRENERHKSSRRELHATHQGTTHAARIHLCVFITCWHVTPDTFLREKRNTYARIDIKTRIVLQTFIPWRAVSIVQFEFPIIVQLCNFWSDIGANFPSYSYPSRRIEIILRLPITASSFNYPVSHVARSVYGGKEKRSQRLCKKPRARTNATTTINVWKNIHKIMNRKYCGKSQYYRKLPSVFFLS